MVAGAPDPTYVQQRELKWFLAVRVGRISKLYVPIRWHHHILVRCVAPVSCCNCTFDGIRIGKVVTKALEGFHLPRDAKQSPRSYEYGIGSSRTQTAGTLIAREKEDMVSTTAAVPIRIR